MAKVNKSAPSPTGKGAASKAVGLDVAATTAIKAEAEVEAGGETIDNTEVFPLHVRLFNNTPVHLALPGARVEIPSNVGPHDNFADVVFKDADERTRFQTDVAQLEALNNWFNAVTFGEPLVAIVRSTVTLTLELVSAASPAAYDKQQSDA